MATTVIASTHGRSAGGGTHSASSRRRRPAGPTLVELTILVAIAALLVLGVVAVGRGVSRVPAGRLSVQVQQGDSLWGIASAHPVAGMTTAELVDQITRDNGLRTGTLAAGQTILIPHADASEDNLALR